MTKLQAVRKFAAEVAGQKVVIARQRLHNNWAMCVHMFDTELRMMVPTDFDYETDEGDRAFRKDFIARYAPAQGFSNATLSILHEIGHEKTKWDGNGCVFLDNIKRKRVKTQKEYMMLESERRATDWAIQWLYSADHRRLAKQFEKEFFGY